ncbi:MAG TPA: polyprenyl synthetase family protein [Candidatus Onthomorpha intestinigallinarum]|uniref:Polyprenyl synthetase family protein n=1 Tax=Candidatus Onthomorpha intestinigallinarum TaxID=2840880 RepID=A0A9D1UGE3_9BACT|nr:polyprenyl synthetase family protein [Candidatus Onthomorpha intestinigallinarum]
MRLQQISGCVSREFEEFDRLYSRSVSFDKGTLGQALRYVLSQHGKRIRPLLIILMAKACGQVTDSTYRSAVILELLHTASLVHDDVLDKSDTRHNRPTVSRKWGNNTAVLLGDYLYGLCLQIIETREDFELMSIYSRIARELPMGEILQKDISERQDVSLDSYYEVIRYKTASLFGAACYIGAKTSRAKDDYVSVAEDFGRNLGMAFQIRDDILDFDTRGDSGKGFGNDIYEKKITLPLIFHLETLSSVERKRLFSFIRQDEKENDKVLAFVNEVLLSGALEKAEQLVEYYSDKAKMALLSLPESEYRNSLGDLVDCLVARRV